MGLKMNVIGFFTTLYKTGLNLPRSLFVQRLVELLKVRGNGGLV